MDNRAYLKHICASADLAECSLGRRFQLSAWEAVIPAFVIRYQDQPRAFVNRCAHMTLELDIVPGRFFDRDKRFLMCATHGALYDPESGECRGGPCYGNGLEPVRVQEKNGMVLLADEQYLEVVK